MRMSVWTSVSRTVARWLVASLLAGLLVGGFEGAASASRWSDGLLSFWVGGALVSALGIPVALLMSVADVLVSFAGSRLKGSCSTPGGAALQAAQGLALSCVVVGLMGGLALLLVSVRKVTETDELLVAGALGSLLLVAAALGSWLVLTAFFFPLMEQLESVVGLPRPRSPVARDLLYFLVPVGLFLGGAIGSTPVAQLREAAALCLMLATSWVIFRALGRRPGVSRKVFFPVLLAWLALFAMSGLVFRPESGSVAEKPGLARLALDQARFLSDVDGDGRSSLWGGGDCAPWNPDRSPEVAEIPENGVDDDCDGFDQERSPRTSLTQRSEGLFSEALSTKRVRPYNVIWLMLDTLRADRMQLLGYKRKNTPGLQELKKSSLVFARAYSQSSGTPTSIASMLSGKTPGSIHWTNGTGGTRRPQLHSDVLTVAERFRDAGYRTGGFLSRGMLKLIPKTMQGFDDLRGLRGKTGSTELVIDLLNADPKFHQDQLKRPFFIFGYYHGAHAPYRGEYEFGKRSKDKYDAAVKRTDREVSMLLQYLRHHPKIWRNTILVIHSDHGEEFFEHGQRFHNNTCHIESTRIPILIRVPGIKAASIELPVANVDIVPTLLELTGVDAGNTKELDGESLLIPALTKRGMPSRPVLCYQQDRKGDGKIHGTVRNDKYYLDTSLQSDAIELFDITRDPRELKNVYPQHKNDPEVRSLLQVIKENHTSNLIRGRWATMK